MVGTHPPAPHPPENQRQKYGEDGCKNERSPRHGIDYSLARKDTQAFVESTVIHVRTSNTTGMSFGKFRHEFTNYDEILGAFKDEGEPYRTLKERVHKLYEALKPKRGD